MREIDKEKINNIKPLPGQSYDSIFKEMVYKFNCIILKL